MDEQKIIGENTCPRCGTKFVCGMAAGEEHCWCASLPALLPPDPSQGCYCPTCLKALIDQVRS